MKTIFGMPLKDYGNATVALVQFLPRNQDQKIGTSHARKTPDGFVFIRNKDSYTIKKESVL